MSRENLDALPKKGTFLSVLEKGSGFTTNLVLLVAERTLSPCGISVP